MHWQCKQKQIHILVARGGCTSKGGHTGKNKTHEMVLFIPEKLS